MANRVNVNVNVNDLSRTGLNSFRRSLRQAQRQAATAGRDIRFNVVVDPDATQRQIRRMRRILRNQPVVLNTRLNPPTPPATTLRRRIAATLGRAITLPVRLSYRTSRSVVAAIFRPIRGLISGILNDGIGQGILGAFKAAGPVGVTILAGAITAGVALIGAALAGVLVLAFGAAFVGLGAFMAIKSDEIQRNWSKAAENIKKSFEGTGDALIKPIHRGIHLLEQAAQDFAPQFEQAMEAAAPSIDKFITSLDRGIRAFGERAFEPMMKGFDAFLLAFGPEFESFLQGLGDAFGNLGRTAQRHSGEIAMALRMVLGLITTMIDIVNFFANVWAQALRFIHFNLGIVFSAFSVMVKGIVTGFSGVLSALAEVADFLPGPLASNIRGARDRFNEFGNGVVENLDRMGQESRDWGLTMDKANKRRQLQVDIETFKARLKIARDDLTRTAGKKARAKVQADIAQLERELGKARRELDALNGKTANTYVNVWRRNQDYGGNSVTGGRAHGGVIGAAATGGVRSNMTLVGEQGPELVRLPSGSNVRSNSDTRRIMSQQGGGGGAAVIEIRSGGSRLDDLLIEILKKAVHVRGGDVQIVLGRN